MNFLRMVSFGGLRPGAYSHVDCSRALAKKLRSPLLQLLGEGLGRGFQVAS